MARIELRHCVVRIKDGLAGTAKINGMGVMAGDTSLTIDTNVLNTVVTDRVPIGARFTIAGESASTTVHVVTARTGGSGTTTAITFSPPLTAGTYADEGVLTFTSNQIDIKIGDGDLKYTETTEYNYDLDRGDLDTVREGNQVPMEVSLNFTYEHITTGTSETIAPMDAIKRKGSASEWVSTASDPCEPYAVDVVVVHTPPCGNSQGETTTFPDFRSEKREPNFKDSNISITGRCNAVEPEVVRS